MKKYICLIATLVASASLALISCGGDSPAEGGTTGGGTTTGGNNSTETTWNKENTFNVYYISALNDRTQSGNVNDVINYLDKLGDKCSLAFVDRTDVLNYNDPSSCVNATTELSFRTRRFATFALNGYQGNDIEGGTVLFNHKINSALSEKVSDKCFMHFVPVQVTSIYSADKKFEYPFATVKLSTAEDVNALQPALDLFYKADYKASILGMVKKDLVDALKAKVATKSSLVFTQITEGSEEYVIFMASRTAFTFREVTKENVGSATAYCISIEAK